MNFVYDPKIAAQIAAYVNYVTPVKGAQGGAREDRSRAGVEPAHLSQSRRRSRTSSSSTPKRSTTRSTSRSGRRCSARKAFLTWGSSTGIAPPSMRCSRRASPGSCCSSSSRSATWATSRCSSGTFPDYTFTWAFVELPGRDLGLPGAADPVVRLRRDRDGHRARVQLPARVLDRVQGGPVEERLPGPRDRAVLRHLPDPHDRLADDPRGRGLRARTS